MRVVVDASVVVAALMADGTVRDVLLSSTAHDYFAPQYIEAELTRNLSRIAARAHLSIGTVRVLTEDALEVIDLLPNPAYGDELPDARSLAAAAGALGDEDYVAVALLLDAPIWTLDHDLRRVRRIRTLSTRDLIELGA